MKARKVKGLDPDMPLDDALRRLAATRLDELYSFADAVRDPEAAEELHDMRIAAKRLRYVLEMSEPVLGPPAKLGARRAKKLQDLLGGIHDCDEHLLLVEGHVDWLAAEDAAAVQSHTRAGTADLDPSRVREAPNRRHYAGLAALATYLRARRSVLYRRFVREWAQLDEAGFAASLDGKAG